MATLTQHLDPASAAFARAGEAILRRMADAQASVLDYAFAVKKRSNTGTPGMEALHAQSTLLEVRAMRADVDAAPVELNEDDGLSVDGVPYRIARRTDIVSLGHVYFVLEPAA